MYIEKYLKYKNKYLQLKHKINILYGGDHDKRLIDFIRNNYNNHSDMFIYFSQKFNKNIIPENLDEYIQFCIPFIKNLQEFLYTKLSEESKKKDIIKIFSYATGTGTVEALFCMYLKEIHGKSVELIFADVLDTSVIINSYGLFNNPVINIYSTTPDKDPSFRFILIEESKKEEIKKKHIDYFKKLYNFDIFITNNGQHYHYDMIIDKYQGDYEKFYASPDNYYLKENIPPKDIKIFYDVRFSSNERLKLIYKIINFVMPIEIQHSIPMIWLQWEPQLDLSDVTKIESSSRKLLEDDRLQKQWGILPEYVISTIDNINKIFRIP